MLEDEYWDAGGGPEGGNEGCGSRTSVATTLNISIAAYCSAGSEKRYVSLFGSEVPRFGDSAIGISKTPPQDFQGFSTPQDSKWALPGELRSLVGCRSVLEFRPEIWDGFYEVDGFQISRMTTRTSFNNRTWQPLSLQTSSLNCFYCADCTAKAVSSVINEQSATPVPTLR